MSEPTPTQQPITPELKALAARLLKLDDLLISCMRCGFCLATCPVYGATMKEADATRGKIALLEYLSHHMTNDPEAVYDKLGRCLLCGSCQSVCPSGVRIMDIFLHARGIVRDYLGLSSTEKFIFRGLLAKPKLFNALLGISAKFQGLFVKEADAALGTYKAPMLNSFIGDRHFPRLASESFHSKTSSLDESPGSTGLRAAFFPGCATDKIFPSVADATLKILRKHGVGVFMPDNLACCGIPALSGGDISACRTMITHNLGLLRQGKFDYLITPCATCASTIKEFWPKMSEGFSPADQELISLLHDKTMDITAFLTDALKVSLPAREGGGKRVTYHDSCHLRKSLGVFNQPRAILKSLPGFEFVEMAEADRCCGSGGSFMLKHYDLSKNIGQRKRDNITAVKPDTVAAACPACMMQLMDMLSQNGDAMKVRHVAEMYAETL
ncbi:MAG: (Fe-S)-binding protein [Desulfovibrio sp.]|jgi:glycolate oxidase iron-sulfur subunit|nr:(Fe-S)-binding protein [Desulfovibrio sp.]